MADYKPVPLSRYTNVARSFYGIHVDPPLGKQMFRGMPFHIAGRTAKKQFIGLTSKSKKGITVPIGAAARHVIFAHTLLESKLDEGEPVGRVVATYVFKLADGDEVRVPIRERFEVAAMPVPWGGLPFLSHPDYDQAMQPRWHGPYGGSGRRQTEADQAWPHGYLLWAWENPKPQVKVESVTIEPGGRKFAVAAITLGLIDEPPFNTQARVPVKITLPKSADAKKPFDLSVEVDRGVATYPYSLPAERTEKFLADDRKGWGEANNNASSPAYVEIAARPSATVTVKHGKTTLGKAKWGDVTSKGKVTAVTAGGRAKLELLDRGKNWVHTTVIDDETGKPIPCRIHFRSPQGVPYQPHGHHDHVNSNLGTWHIDVGGDMRLGHITYAYIDGTCQGWLPRGEVIVDAARGFEYEPVRQKVTIKPGQRELTVRMKRWTHMAKQRWFSGDTHVHFLGTQGAHREAGGEDLHVVNLLASQWGHLFTNTEDFIGRPTVSPDGNTIVYCTQENRQHVLGHLTLLGLKKHVSPWCSDGPSEAELGGNLEITLSRWADACHDQGGTVVIPHIPMPNGEPSTLIATGRADAVEMLIHGRFQHQEYYKYLNCGYRLPLVGGTDKMSSDVPVGVCRTYAYIPDSEPFSYDSWCAALRGGRTFLSSGPIITFKAEGAMIGDTLRLPEGGGTVEVEATAESIFPIHTLQIVQNGNVVASTDEKKGSRVLRLKAKVKVDKHSWLAARCAGPNYEAQKHHDGWGRGIFAHTSPVYIACGGEWWMFDQSVANYMLTLIDGSLEYIRHTALHTGDNVTHHHDHTDHVKYLEEPFHEAAAAIHKRMHQLGVPH